MTDQEKIARLRSAIRAGLALLRASLQAEAIAVLEDAAAAVADATGDSRAAGANERNA